MTTAVEKECRLRELLEQRIDAYECLTKERFEALRESINVAKQAVDDRLEKLNEVRAMVAEWRLTFEPVGRVETLKERLESQINVLTETVERRVSNLERAASNQTGRVSATTYLIGLAIVLVPILSLGLFGAVVYVIQQLGR